MCVIFSCLDFFLNKYLQLFKEFIEKVLKIRQFADGPLDRPFQIN